MKKDFSKYLWGILLILLGVVVVLKSFGIVNQSIFFTGWWTLFIIMTIPFRYATRHKRYMKPVSRNATFNILC